MLSILHHVDDEQPVVPSCVRETSGGEHRRSDRRSPTRAASSTSARTQGSSLTFRIVAARLSMETET